MSKYGDYAFKQVLELMNKNDATLRSPNNVRRLFISATGAIVMFHVPQANKIQSKLFDRQAMYECLQSRDYVPMLQAVVDKGLCSNIENIVISRTDNVNGITLTQRDWNLGTLVDGYHNSDVSKRYKRLDSIIVTNYDIQTLYSICQKYEDCKIVLSQSEMLRQSSMINPVSPNGWFNHYKLRGSSYGFEASGGILEQHFENVKKEMSSRRLSSDDISNLKLIWSKLRKLMKVKDMLEVIANESNRLDILFNQELPLCNIQIKQECSRQWIRYGTVPKTFSEANANNYDTITDYYIDLYYWLIDVMLNELSMLQKKDYTKYMDFVMSGSKKFNLSITEPRLMRRSKRIISELALNLKGGEIMDKSIIIVLRNIADLVMPSSSIGKLKREYQKELPEFSTSIITAR